MTSLPELLSALRAATGADREIDTCMWLALTPGATRKATLVESDMEAWPAYVIDETRDETRRLIIVPAYTASLDAITALIERKLPEVTWFVGHSALTKAAARNTFAAILDIAGQWHSADAPTPALALCIALVEAMIAMEASNA